MCALLDFKLAEFNFLYNLGVGKVTERRLQ